MINKVGIIVDEKGLYPNHRHTILLARQTELDVVPVFLDCNDDIKQETIELIYEYFDVAYQIPTLTDLEARLLEHISLSFDTILLFRKKDVKVITFSEDRVNEIICLMLEEEKENILVVDGPGGFSLTNISNHGDSILRMDDDFNQLIKKQDRMLPDEQNGIATFVKQRFPRRGKKK